MIHYHECRRCTHEWRSACFDHIGLDEKQLVYRHRHMVSWLCHDCFDMLEAGEIEGLNIFDLYEYLDTKSEKYGASKTWRVFKNGTEESPWYNHQKLSGMCHEFISSTFNEDGSYKDKGNFVSGYTAEHKQLQKLVSEIQDIYLSIIEAQRTPKRIELDEFQKTAGVVIFGSQPRPEGFEGDPPGKARIQFLFGLDPASGDLIAPRIVMQNGANGTDSKN